MLYQHLIQLLLDSSAFACTYLAWLDLRDPTNLPSRLFLAKLDIDAMPYVDLCYAMQTY